MSKGDNMQFVLSRLRKACDQYNMIEPNDKIAVGVSGGKDSTLLLVALHRYSKFSKIPFSVVGITIDSFGHPEDFDPIKKMCEDEGIEYHIIPSDIYKIVFVDRKESSPCSLCSKLRRGTLNTEAIKLGCNKLALGHTKEDVIDTFFLSMIYEGRLNTFKPTTYMSRTKMVVIRPFIFLDEHTISCKVKNLGIPVVKSRCPVDKHTNREFVRQYTDQLEAHVPQAKDRIFSAIISEDRYSLFDKRYIADDKNDTIYDNKQQK